MLETKSSGIDWLDKIPASWKIERMKNQFEYTKGLNITKADLIDVGVAVVSYGQIHAKNNPGTTLKDEFIRYIYPSNEAITDKAKLCNGDIVFADTSEDYDGLGNAVYMDRDTETYAGYHTIIARPKEPRYAKFFAYLFQSESWRSQLRMRASGIKVYSVTQRMLNDITLIMPKDTEVEPICSYLDDRCSKIDTIIAEAKASIEEYKELKQAVITQAVTLGIKKNRSLKDTNILWIGKMPCDWQLAELKFFASIKSGITLGQKYPAGAKLVEMPYLRVANVQGEYVDLSDVKTIQVLPEEVDKYRLEAGVVLMTEGGDRDKLGRGCVWHGEITPCLHQNHIFALTTKSDKLLPEYFSHVTTSEVARCYFDYTAKKTTNLANTNSSTIMNFRLPIPPLEEQRKIVQYLDKRIKTLNDMISEKQSLIEDLESYKKSLIYEVVTGKRKVVA